MYRSWSLLWTLASWQTRLTTLHLALDLPRIRKKARAFGMCTVCCVCNIWDRHHATYVLSTHRHIIDNLISVQISTQMNPVKGSSREEWEALTDSDDSEEDDLVRGPTTNAKSPGSHTNHGTVLLLQPAGASNIRSRRRRHRHPFSWFIIQEIAALLKSYRCGGRFRQSCSKEPTVPRSRSGRFGFAHTACHNSRCRWKWLKVWPSDQRLKVRPAWFDWFIGR